MRKHWKRLQAAALLALALASPSAAQNLGYVGLYTTSEEIFDGASCAAAPLTTEIPNVGQNVHYFIYETAGTVTAISVEIQGRNDDAGTWQRISAGTATNTTSGGLFANIYLNHVRIAVTACSGTGTVSGTYSGTSVAATPEIPFFATGQGSISACVNQAAISFTAAGAGSTRIITNTGAGRRVFICHISAALSTAVDLTIERGTGVNCGTGTADLAGPYQNISTFALDFGTAAALAGTAGADVCLNVTAATTVGGVVIYAEF